MTEEFNTHLRATLIKLLHAAQCKVSANTLINEIQKQKEKFPKKYLQSILLDIGKADKLADKIYKELQSKCREDITAAEFLLQFLTDYDKLKNNRKAAGNRQNFVTIAEDDENQRSVSGVGDVQPAALTQNRTSSNIGSNADANGNVPEVTKDNVKEVLKKVMQEAGQISSSKVSQHRFIQTHQHQQQHHYRIHQFNNRQHKHHKCMNPFKTITFQIYAQTVAFTRNSTSAKILSIHCQHKPFPQIVLHDR